jgi:hypothetical protein
MYAAYLRKGKKPSGFPIILVPISMTVSIQPEPRRKKILTTVIQIKTYFAVNGKKMLID